MNYIKYKYKFYILDSANLKCKNSQILTNRLYNPEILQILHSKIKKKIVNINFSIFESIREKYESA